MRSAPLRGRLTARARIAQGHFSALPSGPLANLTGIKPSFTAPATSQTDRSAFLKRTLRARLHLRRWPEDEQPSHSLYAARGRPALVPGSCRCPPKRWSGYEPIAANASTSVAPASGAGSRSAAARRSGFEFR
jgi:hypothetical protein